MLNRSPVETAILDLIDDPENDFYTLARWHEDGMHVTFNHPIAIQLEEILRDDESCVEYDIEAVGDYDLRFIKYNPGFRRVNGEVLYSAAWL